MKTPRIEIQNHPTSEAHKLVKVYTASGRVYAATYAEPYPTEAEALQAWTENRKDFPPYFGG